MSCNNVAVSIPRRVFGLTMATREKEQDAAYKATRWVRNAVICGLGIVDLFEAFAPSQPTMIFLVAANCIEDSCFCAFFWRWFAKVPQVKGTASQLLRICW